MDVDGCWWMLMDWNGHEWSWMVMNGILERYSGQLLMFTCTFFWAPHCTTRTTRAQNTSIHIGVIRGYVLYGCVMTPIHKALPPGHGNGIPACPWMMLRSRASWTHKARVSWSGSPASIEMSCLGKAGLKWQVEPCWISEMYRAHYFMLSVSAILWWFLVRQLDSFWWQKVRRCPKSNSCFFPTQAPANWRNPFFSSVMTRNLAGKVRQELPHLTDLIFFANWAAKPTFLSLLSRLALLLPHNGLCDLQVFIGLIARLVIIGWEVDTISTRRIHGK